MERRPNGPRSRVQAEPPYASSSAAAGGGASAPVARQDRRDAVFSEVFGRRAAVHHMHAPPQQQPGRGAYLPMPPSGGPGLPYPPGGGVGYAPGPPPRPTAGAYDQYAGSVGVGLPPGTGPPGVYSPSYGYPTQQHAPAPNANVYNRRASISPSIYSDGDLSSLHGSNGSPTPQHSLYHVNGGGGGPNNRVASASSQYYQQHPASSGGYAASSSPNLAVPGAGNMERSRTLSSQRSIMSSEPPWESGAGYTNGGGGGYAPGASSSLSSASAPGSAQLTPAQVYQAQVGGPSRQLTAAGYVPAHIAHRQQASPTGPYMHPPPPSTGSAAMSSPSSASASSSFVSLGSQPEGGAYQQQQPSPPPLTSTSTSTSRSERPPRLPSFDKGYEGLGLGSLDLGTGGDERGGGTVTPRPMNDDSELGYLAGGASENTSATSSVYSGSARNSLHARTPSESSMRSVGGEYGIRSQFAPLSRIDTGLANYHTVGSPTSSSPAQSVAGIDPGYIRRHVGSGGITTGRRESIDSSRSLPTLQRGASSGDLRSASFSSQMSRAEATASIRSNSRSSNHHPPIPTHLPSSSYGGNGPPSAMTTSMPNKRAGSITPATRRQLQIMPALLSRVANAFRTHIVLSERTKAGLVYKDAFDGKEAVDLICEILQTSDRNIALLLGRALEDQKFYHDVTYDHKLRDSATELYQFRAQPILPAVPFTTPVYSHDGGTPPGDEDGSGSAHDLTNSIVFPPSYSSSTSINGLPATPQHQLHQGETTSIPASSIRGLPTAPHHSSDSGSLPTRRTSILTTPRGGGSSGVAAPLSPSSVTDNNNTPSSSALELDDEQKLPTGVFTILLSCYSPTCNDRSLCYSIACPRRVVQAKLLNLTPQPGLQKTAQVEDEKDGEGDAGATLWATGISEEFLATVDSEERKRQEAINELIFTEKDFVRDLEYLRDFWMAPLRAGDIIQPPERRESFLQDVFWNVLTILNKNSVLSDRFQRRKNQAREAKTYVIDHIGDILLELVPTFQPFIEYGGHQAYGKLEFEKEKASNAEFLKFVDEVERKPESRKIELNGFLTRPTTRLGRYPLLLKAILKLTKEDNDDFRTIPLVLKMFDDFLERVNTAAGKTQNRMDLQALESALRPAESHTLRLKDEHRELVHKGQFKRRGGSAHENADLEVYLLDNVLVLSRYKPIGKNQEELRLYKRPIPLELLTMVTLDESYNLSKHGIRPKSLLSRTSTSKSGGQNEINKKPEKEGKHGFSITFHYLGRSGYSLTLWTASHIQRKKWLEIIDRQQTIIREQNRKLEIKTLETVFAGGHKVNCATPYDGGRRMMYGTDDGVYFSNLTEPDRPPVLLLPLLDVTQVDVLESFQLLIVLSERSVQTFPLEALSPQDPSAALRRGKRVSSHTTFFKAGVCMGRTLVCIVKSSPLSSTIKVMDPVEAQTKKKPQGAAFSKLMPTKTETLRVFKEFYIPTESTSIHFLKTKLCVGCTKGFEIVDLETLDTQGLLDPADPNLDLVHKPRKPMEQPLVRPIAIYRIEGDFLLCYDEFAFYVNRNGWRVGGPRNRDDVRWRITWEGTPTHFALQYPWVLAFDPNFVEVWNVNTGVFTQVIQGANIRLLFADTPPSAVHSQAQLQQQQQRLAYGRPGGPGPGPGRPPPPHGYNPYAQQQGYTNGGGGMHPPHAQMRPPPMHQQLPPRMPPAPPPNPRSQIVLDIDGKISTVVLRSSV